MSKKNSQLQFLILLGSAVVVTVAVMLSIKSGIEQEPIEPIGGLQTGKPAPVIEASGWLNGEAPTQESLKGKVVVVEAWMLNCLGCLQEAKHLVRVHYQYQNRGVVFIGLTSDDEFVRDYIKEFLDTQGITWLNGYGADKTLLELEAYYVPAVWVIGPDGRIVWNMDSTEPLEAGIENALAAGS